MIKNLLSAVLLFTIIVDGKSLFCQSNESEPSHNDLKKHSVGLVTGYTWVPQSVDQNGDEEIVVLPTLGLDYAFRLNEKWALGSMNEVEFARYLVKDEDGSLLKRENKFITSAVVLYEPIHFLAIYAGPGYEFEKHRNFPLLKTGVELLKHFEEGWVVGFNAGVDINELYQAVTMGVVVAVKL